MRVLQLARRAAVARSTLRAATRANAAAFARPAVASALPNAFASLPLNAVPSRGFASKFIDDDDDDLFGGEDDEDESFIQYPMPTVKIGARAPGFTAAAVHKDEIVDLSLEQFRGKYVVLFFYPKDFTYVCPTEIIAFNDRAAEFEAINTQLIAVSTDSPESHLAWTKLPRSKGGLGDMTIPIVADITKIISAKYGVLIEEEGIALRGLFIMDKEGVVHQMTVNNLPIGRSVDETLRLVQALQFTEEHGEVCPANWKPGEKTIIADPKEAHKYFSTVKDAEDADDSAGMTLLKTKKDFESLIQSGKTVVAKFEAPWCGKCAQIQPFVKELADKHSDVTFAKLDVTLPEIEKLKEEMGVEALPAFRFFKGGKEVGTPVLGYKKTPLKNAVEELAH